MVLYLKPKKVLTTHLSVLCSIASLRIILSKTRGKIVLSVSLKEFAVRSMPGFKPNVLLHNDDSLSNYGINARIISLPGHTDGSIGIDVDNKHLIVGDALMNMFYPTVSMLYHNRGNMLESARKISNIGNRTIYFGHGRPVTNKRWVK